MVSADHKATSVLSNEWNTLLNDYADVFESPGPPVSRSIDHKIDLLNPDVVPPRPRLYRISEEELAAVKKTLNEYLEKGWIRPSTSPWGAPVIIIKKKTGELRIVIDYRLLNK